MAGRTFSGLDEIRDHLRAFHSADVENTDRLSLEDLCEIGVWSIRRLATCEDTGKQVVQEWEGGDKWLCLHCESDEDTEKEVQRFKLKVIPY